MGRHRFAVSVCVFLLLGMWTSTAHARVDIVSDMVRKQNTKVKTRFSVSDWFGSQRSQIQIQDLFLAIHAPSPYEFYLGGDYVWAQPNGSSRFSGQTWRMSVAAYVSIFGLALEKEFRKEMWSGVFNLRVFGFNVQSTNITLHGGLRSQENPTIYRSPFVGGTMTIYIGKYFGFEGLYRHYFRPLTNDAGIDTEGSRWEGSVFVDYRVLRVYASYFTEGETVITGTVPDPDNFTGIALGVKVFF